MGSIDHFTYGPITPLIAYAMSCTGSALGLLCTSRSRVVHGAARARWLALGALSIGGTGIWVMHFVAMLGFSVSGSGIRYDVTRTVLSLLLAIAIVGVGLAIVGYAGSRPVPLVVAGVITGTGVAVMHYTGMSALSEAWSIHYNTLRVALSVVIAVVAATAALWAAMNVRGTGATFAASLIMGAAVTGMHYTAMSAVSVDTAGMHHMVEGADPSQFLAPLITGISLFTMVTLFIVALSPSVDEMAEEAELNGRLERLTQSQRSAIVAHESEVRRQFKDSPPRRRRAGASSSNNREHQDHSW